jgi:predicted transcriptional regulator
MKARSRSDAYDLCVRNYGPAPVATATNAGTDPERLVKEATLRLLEEDVRFRAAVREGIEQADRGEFIEEAEMDARLEQMLRS